MRKALQILGSLADTDTEWMAETGLLIEVESGETLVEEGKQIDSLYVVLDGCLSVHVGAGPESEIARLYAGEIIGEISLITGTLPTATVVAVEVSIILAVKHAKLSDRMAFDVGFAARFYGAVALFLATRLTVTSSRLGYGDIREDISSDELQDCAIDNMSLASLRFDRMRRDLMYRA